MIAGLECDPASSPGELDEEPDLLFDGAVVLAALTPLLLLAGSILALLW